MAGTQHYYSGKIKYGLNVLMRAVKPADVNWQNLLLRHYFNLPIV
ncbi:hypothetical protein PPRY_b0367 [Pseudoalteromonas prydzensis ACAM 620]|nr:hypothetical protein [Pseudoalteromonas prydzensis ACAM 620]